MEYSPAMQAYAQASQELAKALQMGTRSKILEAKARKEMRLAEDELRAERHDLFTNCLI